MNIIYIPTFKRHNNQIFFDSLPDRLKSRVIFVIQKQEEQNMFYIDNFSKDLLVRKSQ